MGNAENAVFVGDCGIASLLAGPYHGSVEEIICILLIEVNRQRMKCMAGIFPQDLAPDTAATSTRSPSSSPQKNLSLRLASCKSFSWTSSARW